MVGVESDAAKAESIKPQEAPEFAAARAASIDPNAAPKADATGAAEAAGSKEKKHDSAVFLAVKPEKSAKTGSTVMFMAAITPEDAKAAAAGQTPEEAAKAAGKDDVDIPEGPNDYPGDDAPQEELAQWMAREAARNGLPSELPVMASLVESEIRNMSPGDAPQAGFFGMSRVDWDKGDYEGFPDNPGLQAKWFIDQALEVKEQAIANGDANFGQDPSSWGDWVAEIEQPPEEFRGRYQARLDEARLLLDA